MPVPRSSKDRDQPRPRGGRTYGRSRWGPASGGRWPSRAEEPFGVKDGVTSSKDARLYALVPDTEAAYSYHTKTVRLPLLYMLVPPPSAVRQACEATEEGALVAALRAGDALNWSQPVRSTQSGEPLLAADRDRWLSGPADEPISWREAALHARGSLGEGLLHLCLRQSAEPGYRRLALLLLSPTEGPFDAAGVAQLARQQYEGRRHRGLSGLHLAALADDPELVRAVLRAGAAGAAPPRADGSFFYASPSLYFGGSPIGLAACAGCGAALAELLRQPEARAALRATDEGPLVGDLEAESRPLGFCVLGNSPLHCAVLRGRAEHLGAMVAAGASPSQRNAWGQTALSLAAERGDPAVFAAALQATASLLWDFGPHRRVRYPLLEVDPLLAPQNEARAHLPPHTNFPSTQAHALPQPKSSPPPPCRPLASSLASSRTALPSSRW